MPLDTSLLLPLLTAIPPETVVAKTLLLREGAVSGRAIFIEQGALRVWFNDEGRDITVQFFFEGEMVTAIESFVSGQASLVNIETMEKSVLRFIPKERLIDFMAGSEELRGKMQEQLLQRLFFYQKLFLSRIRHNPEQRYRELLESQPELLTRVPQRYLASYLGMTPVSLSRIRSRR